jgi:SAM-dependent methyltransferase
VGAEAEAALRSGFDRLAASYRWLEWLSFGPLLGRARRRYLDRLAEARQVLVIGDGDGRFTAALLRRNPRVEVVAVDASAAMLGKMLARAGNQRHRVAAVHADARGFRPAAGTGSFDAVVTHFFLDCLSTAEVAALARRLAAHVVPGGVWIVSEFALPRRGWARLPGRALVALLYRAFRILAGLGQQSLPDWQGALEAAGFARREGEERLAGVVVCECRQRAAAGDSPLPAATRTGPG